MIIDKNEALRYLGYKGQKVDINLENLLDQSIQELYLISKGKYIYDIFDLERQRDCIYIKGTAFYLHGKDIKTHLEHSEKCALMAVTLGLEVDKHIIMYSKTHLTKSVIFDACASAAVEGLCDRVEEEIKVKAQNTGYVLTSRYSPGYGDFPLSTQEDLLRILNAYNSIGLSVSENHIMLPRKSVTAVMGLQKKDCVMHSNKCSQCDNYDCEYRRNNHNEG